MDIPQVEKLISDAIANRPGATNAPLNLYIYKGRIVCGARAVMPKNALFISHITADNIQQGFNESEWKVIVEKTLWLLCDRHGAINEEGDGDFKERRRELRLKLKGNVWVNQQGRDKTLQGQMVDISSRGMAFTCYDKDGVPECGQQVIARFSVPFFTPQGNVEERKFTRVARVCRINNANSYLKRIAVQFAEPLPFKPAEQEQAADVDVVTVGSDEI